MFKWLNEMLSSESNKSSARVINFIGAVNGGMLLAYDTYIHQMLSVECYGLYLAFCGGVYVIGKKLDKDKKDD